MSGRHVYIIWSNPLFQEVIRLLLSGSSLEVVGSSSDHAQARDDIEQLSPDVVLIETPEGSAESSDETITILQSGSRVIRLSLADNDLSIYRRERRTVRDIADLIGVLTNGSEIAVDGDETL